MATIDLEGLDGLANTIGGRGSGQHGRMSLDQLVAFSGNRAAEITEPAVLLRINRLYRHGMSDAKRYDVTRTAWAMIRQRPLSPSEPKPMLDHSWRSEAEEVTLRRPRHMPAGGISRCRCR